MNSLEEYIEKQREWSLATFGPGLRTGGIVAHIKKELIEIEEEPESLEWIDVIILGLDGAWRAGYDPDDIVRALVDKQDINFARDWPEPVSQDEPVEHVR